jgi:hypothetical protein
MVGFLKRISSVGLEVIAGWFEAAKRRRELRDEISWTKFSAAERDARACGYRIGVVTGIRQHARTGTKAWMRWVSDPSDQRSVDSVWVWHTRLQTGSMLVVSGSYGHGDHHQETVFYINRLEGQLDRRDYDGWMRHERRISRVPS